MTKQDRTTLKAYFRDGALPSAQHYRDLIDSSVNQVEDGFEKTPGDGLKLTSVGASPRLLSLYQGLGAPQPSWVLDHGEDTGSLHLRRGPGMDAARPQTGHTVAEGQKAFSLSEDGRLGVHNETPDYRLDVDGVARMAGRIGVRSPKVKTVLANGKWQPITPTLTGCQAFEVIAGAGGTQGKGYYSLVHAIAMNAFHPRNPILNCIFGRRRIRTQTAMYGSFAHRIRLRWKSTGERHQFRLEIRTNTDFTDKTGEKEIQFYLTRLWFDTFMNGSRGGANRDEDVI